MLRKRMERLEESGAAMLDGKGPPSEEAGGDGL